MKVGDQVEKITGDYNFTGTVVAVFQKLNGNVRLVVENSDGILHIFSESNLKKRIDSTELDTSFSEWLTTNCPKIEKTILYGPGGPPPDEHCIWDEIMKDPNNHGKVFGIVCTCPKCSIR